jgi:hypothetical protein
MFGVEAQVGIGMKDLGKREPALRQSFDPRPGHPTSLAAAPERTKPAADHLEPKTSQTDGKRNLDRPQSGLSGEQFTVFDTLNGSATIVTCIEFAKKPEFRTPIIKRHLEYWKTLCNNLD